jgi:hypothetical protein
MPGSLIRSKAGSLVCSKCWPFLYNAIVILLAIEVIARCAADVRPEAGIRTKL